VEITSNSHNGENDKRSPLELPNTHKGQIGVRIRKERKSIGCVRHWYWKNLQSDCRINGIQKAHTSDCSSIYLGQLGVGNEENGSKCVGALQLRVND
jgi:hypothetical protein